MRAFFFTFYGFVLAALLLDPSPTPARPGHHPAGSARLPIRLPAELPRISEQHQSAAIIPPPAPQSGTRRLLSRTDPSVTANTMLINQYGQHLGLSETLLNQRFVCIGLLNAKSHPHNTTVINALQRLRYSLAAAADPHESVVCCLTDDTTSYGQFSLLQCADRHGIFSEPELPEFHLCYGIGSEISLLLDLLRSGTTHPQATGAVPLLLLGDAHRNDWRLFPATTPADQLMEYFQEHLAVTAESLLATTETCRNGWISQDGPATGTASICSADQYPSLSR